MSYRQYSTGVPRPPKLDVRWFYATDVPTFKPTEPDYVQKIRAAKFLPFAEEDSERIEQNYRQYKATKDPALEVVPVNEDQLFDCNIKDRQLSPAFWNGPSYEARRGTWFLNAEPLPESISDQLEAGYLKSRPWLREPVTGNEDKDSLSEDFGTCYKADCHVESETSLFERVTGQQYPFENPSELETSSKNVLFLDERTAVLLDEEIGLRKLLVDAFARSKSKHIIGGYCATRGYDPSEEQDKEKESKEAKDVKADTEEQEALKKTASTKSTAMGLLSSVKKTIDYEFSNERFQKDMEGDFSNDPSKIENSGDREIDHLILCVHGVGQSLSAKFSGVNFPHDCSNFRRLIKELFVKDPIKYASEAYPDIPPEMLKEVPEARNSRVQVLPIVWRYDINFSWNHVYDDKAEDGSRRLPRLSELNIDAITPLRTLAADVVLDILLYYEPSFKKKIISSVVRSANNLYDKYLSRHPNFKGKVSLCGHSLGSVIALDILCMQPNEIPTGADFDPDFDLKFPVENFFGMGSPNGVFKFMKRQNIRPRTSELYQKEEQKITEPLDRLKGDAIAPRANNCYNIFYPTDVVAYRMEPMVHTAMTQYKPKEIPFADENNINNKINSWANLPTGILNNSMIKSVVNMTGMSSQYKKIVQSARNRGQETELHLPEMAEDMLLDLNKNGRLDYALPQSYFEIDILNALGSHTQYLSDADVASFVVKELWKKGNGKIYGTQETKLLGGSGPHDAPKPIAGSKRS